MISYDYVFEAINQSNSRPNGRRNCGIWQTRGVLWRLIGVLAISSNLRSREEGIIKAAVEPLGEVLHEMESMFKARALSTGWSVWVRLCAHLYWAHFEFPADPAGGATDSWELLILGSIWLLDVAELIRSAMVMVRDFRRNSKILVLLFNFADHLGSGFTLGKMGHASKSWTSPSRETCTWITWPVGPSPAFAEKLPTRSSERGSWKRPWKAFVHSPCTRRIWWKPDWPVGSTWVLGVLGVLKASDSDPTGTGIKIHKDERFESRASQDTWVIVGYHVITCNYMQYLARLILYDSSLLLLLASNVFKLDLLSMRPTSSPSPLQMGQTNCQRVQRQRLFHQRTIFAGASIVIFNQASRHVHSLTTQALLPLPAAQAPVPSQLAHSFRRVVSLTGGKKIGIRSLPQRLGVQQLGLFRCILRRACPASSWHALKWERHHFLSVNMSVYLYVYVSLYICIYIYMYVFNVCIRMYITCMYIYGCWSKFLYPGTAILRE